MISHKHLCAFKLCANKKLATNWLGRLGPTESFKTEYRGVPITSAESWLSSHSQGHAQHLHALALNWDLLVSPPHNRAWVLHSCCHRQMVDSTGLLAAAIPDLGLPKNGCRCWCASATPGGQPRTPLPHDWVDTPSRCRPRKRNISRNSATGLRSTSNSCALPS